MLHINLFVRFIFLWHNCSLRRIQMQFFLVGYKTYRMVQKKRERSSYSRSISARMSSMVLFHSLFSSSFSSAILFSLQRHSWMCEWCWQTRGGTEAYWCSASWIWFIRDCNRTIRVMRWCSERSWYWVLVLEVIVLSYRLFYFVNPSCSFIFFSS